MMPNERLAGIILHPTSLPSPGGIGDFGPELYAFLNFLERARQGLWQILPLSPPGLGNSPYSAISAFAGNPLLISLDRLVERGWLGAADVRVKPLFGPVDFEAVKSWKLPLLRQAAQNFLSEKDGDRRRFEDFKHDNIWWLEDFALFQVMRRIHNGAVWSDWPRGLARREQASLHAFGLEHRDDLEVERAIQFAFFEQWRAVRSYCASRRIKIVGDVAIFVNYDSADVWRNPDIFYLDSDLHPAVVAGVPPDAFSATGQRWGNPLYRWDVLRDQGYSWWVQRMAWALKSCDIVRLDHFRGFESYWEIPASEPTAVRGQWKKGPGDDLFRVFHEQLGELPFIAEDLGMITPAVHALRERLGIPGMKVLQFAFGDPGAHIYLPHNFVPNCVVYTGTHDNDTTRGWWESGAREDERAHAQAYLGPLPAGVDGAVWAFIRAALASIARMAIVPLQDILVLGAGARMNTPSLNDGNWGWRYDPGSLKDGLAVRLGELTEMCDRLPASSAAGQQSHGEMAEDFAA
jgi:4-alpha-glucanotransferase